MHAIRRITLAALLLLAIATPRADASYVTTNYSDQWYVIGENGWGASFLQQAEIIFIDLFVYGADGKPTWFTAAVSLQGQTAAGHLIFSGDLNLTNGPYYGGAFNQNNVTYRKVGTLTFDAASVDTGTLTYTVDGVVVSKNVTRLLWRFENFTGNYYGGIILDYSQCTNPAGNGHSEELGVVNINHSASNTITMAAQINGSNCNYVATYTQAGHMGTMQGNFSCSNGVTGIFTAFEMEKNISGMTGRVVGQNTFCRFSGHFGGLLR